MNGTSLTKLVGAFTLGAILLFPGCGPQKGGEAATPAPSVQAPPADSASAAPAADVAAGVKTLFFHGTPVSIDETAGSISVKHEKIEGFAAEGINTYQVADPAILKQVTVGRETHITLRVAGNKALVTKVQEGHEKGEEHAK